VIEYVNPAFEILTGYSREEAIGETPRLLKSGQQTPELYQELWATILSGNVFRRVLANRKKSGEIFYAEKSITPVRDGEGKITHFISNDRDITERRRLEAQLQQAQKMDAVGKLAGGVAHDFNNPLMVISSYAELMQNSLAPEHPLRRNVQEIMTASRRAADLTRQLLAFSRQQVVTPRVQIDRSSLLSMEKLIQTVTAIAAARQHDALQPFREPIPLRNDVNERLHVSLGDDMTKSAPWPCARTIPIAPVLAILSSPKWPSWQCSSKRF